MRSIPPGNVMRSGTLLDLNAGATAYPKAVPQPELSALFLLIL